MGRYGPKHVELTPMHQKTISAATLCISLECIYIAKNNTRTFQCQVPYRRFGKPIGPIFKGQAVQEECSLVLGSKHTFRLLISNRTTDHILLGRSHECFITAAQLPRTRFKRHYQYGRKKNLSVSLITSVRWLEHPSCHTNKIYKFHVIYFTRSEIQTSLNVD